MEFTKQDREAARATIKRGLSFLCVGMGAVFAFKFAPAWLMRRRLTRVASQYLRGRVGDCGGALPPSSRIDLYEDLGLANVLVRPTPVNLQFSAAEVGLFDLPVENREESLKHIEAQWKSILRSPAFVTGCTKYELLTCWPPSPLCDSVLCEGIVGRLDADEVPIFLQEIRRGVTPGGFVMIVDDEFIDNVFTRWLETRKWLPATANVEAVLGYRNAAWKVEGLELTHFAKLNLSGSRSATVFKVV